MALQNLGENQDKALLFSQVFALIFTPDPYGRFTCQQIALVLEEYFNSINRPELKMTSRQIGSYMGLYTILDRSRSGTTAYHISVKPEWALSEDLLQRLGKIRITRYAKNMIKGLS